MNIVPAKIKKKIIEILKKHQKFLILSSFCFLFFYFFSFSITVTSDSGHYMSYVEILKGNMSFESWDVIRGPIFPIIILLSNILFGKTAIGLLMSNFLWYLLLLSFLFLSLKINLGLNATWKRILFILILFLTVTNPIIFGYYHTFLTEPIAITLSVVICYLSFRFILEDYNFKETKFWIYNILFAFLAIFSWFLKQPYVSIILLPVVLSAIISIINKFEIRNIFYKGFSIFICIFSLIVSIHVWDNILSSKGIDLTTNRNVKNGLGSQLISGVDYFKIQRDSNAYSKKHVNENKYLSTEEKKLLLNSNSENYFMVEIYNIKGEIIETEIVIKENEEIPTIKAIKFLSTSFFKYPNLILDSYFANYMAIINVYGTYSPDGVVYHVKRGFNPRYMNENLTIAYRTFNNNENTFHMSPEKLERVTSFYQVSKPPIFLNKIMGYLCIAYNYIFKFNFILLPVFFISSIFFKVYKTIKKERNKLLDYILLLLGYSFGYILVYTFTGMLIDRYAAPAIVTCIMGNILFFYLMYQVLVRNRNKYNQKKHKNEKKKR